MKVEKNTKKILVLDNFTSSITDFLFSINIR